jgi:hypothetical protein
LWQHRGEIFMGVDDDDLPAAQAFNGNSELLVAPAWRLPRNVTPTTPSRSWVVERLARDYGLACSDLFELGGSYHPSPGISPERVTPLAVSVSRGASAGLLWVRLAELVAAADLLLDGHLRILAWRAAHAFDLLRR